MAKFNENELTEKLQEYKEKAKINLEFERGIDGKIELENGKVEYDKQNGFIKIYGNNCELEINTTMVCGYKKEDGEITIDLETIIVKIQKNIDL